MKPNIINLMNYLILHDGKSFYTNWYSYDNNYVDGMIVFDFRNSQYTTDGIKWLPIEEDHL